MILKSLGEPERWSQVAFSLGDKLSFKVRIELDLVDEVLQRADESTLYRGTFGIQT
jgi:hypothetical protein